ncbi:hypothetical protein GCM10009738_65460 [Kitasatospora viridis]
MVSSTARKVAPEARARATRSIGVRGGASGAGVVAAVAADWDVVMSPSGWRARRISRDRATTREYRLDERSCSLTFGKAAMIMPGKQSLPVSTLSRPCDSLPRHTPSPYGRTPCERPANQKKRDRSCSRLAAAVGQERETKPPTTNDCEATSC